MKKFMIILFAGRVEAQPKKYLNPGITNPCLGPNPPPGCHPPNAVRSPVNTYRRGCSIIHQCRRQG